MDGTALYDRYKNALRSGHIAAVRGLFEPALAAYREAATLAPDRPLPHISLGRVFLKLERIDDALDAFEAALRRAPRDEAALAGRAEALGIAGRPAEAAGVLDLLADLQEAERRIPEATETARHALELAESRARRRHLTALAGELRTPEWEADGEAALSRALLVLDPPVSPDAVASGERSADPSRSAQAGVRASRQRASGSPGPIEAEPEPYSDPRVVSDDLDVALGTGDSAVVHQAVLKAVTAFRGAGLVDAAMDACQLGIAVSPADPDLHLALAELEIGAGWTAVAVDKLVLLDRLVGLTGDEVARGRLRGLVDRRFAGEPRLSALRS